MHQNEEIDLYGIVLPGACRPGDGLALVRKLASNSGIYWDILLNQIDFQPEIGDYWRPVGVIRNTRANYLNLLEFFGKRF
jgi:hypothetical protein